MFDCQPCNREFGSHHASVQHMNAVDHWAPTHECDFCDFACFSKDELDEHRDDRDHHLFECQTCDRCFTSWAATTSHMNAEGHWEHYCKPCQRKFDNANSLRMHLHSCTHQGANIPCPFCKRGFTTGSGLSHHLEKGSCPKAQGVNRQTIYNTLRQRDRHGMITNNLLEWHQETWSTDQAWNGRGFECYLCHRQFAADRHLDQHLSSPAHMQKIYHCPNTLECGSQFTTLAAMFNHLESESCGYIKFKGVQRNVGSFLSGKQKTIGFY